MLGINIVTINGVDNARRGLLLMCDNQEQISRLESILNTMDNITVTKYRPPKQARSVFMYFIFKIPFNHPRSLPL
ncbi:hypothetical protein ACT4UM_08730, partial [Bacillus sp. SS-TM]